MSRSMLMGVVAGIGIATAGGVAGFAMLGKQTPAEQDAAMITPTPAQVEVAPAVTPAAAPAAPAPQRVAAAQPAPRPAPRPAAQPAPTVAAPPPPPAEECWDEEVTVTEAPKDEHAIAGTAIGAVVGGAVGHEVNDSDFSTAAGAAAGAFIGRRLQRHVQENKEEQRTTTTIERRCGPVGSRPVP
jgi:uncharacterized protein YcfJ